MSAQSSFGKYRLIAELGHGGMADVYLAVAQGPQGLGFSKLFVVKKLRKNLAEDPEFVSMLVDEARIAARLNHPNAVQTYEIGEVNGEYFIAMEYLDGQPLSRIGVRLGKLERDLPLNFSLGILADVLAGLHHAHELKDYDGTPLHIVHRDVTPHNVFVTYDGQVKIVDFGIAKAAGRAMQTEQGVVKGKVVYMAPEQASAKDVDRRADIFAVGVMLWEALTGTRMWRGFDELGVMARLISGDIPGPPSTVNPEVDEKLDAIAKRALAFSPADRYATAEEMSTALMTYLDGRRERPLAKQIGQLVAEVFEDRRRETRDVIEAQLAALDHRVSTFKVRVLTTGADSGPTPSKDGLAVALDVTAPADDISAAPTRTHDPTPVRKGSAKGDHRTQPEAGLLLSPAKPKGRSGFVLGAGLGVALAAVVVVVAARARIQAKTVEAPPAPSSSPSAAASSAGGEVAPTISVALTSNVNDTTFRIDDGAARPTPFMARFPRDNGVHVIVASAPGHDDERHEVRFTEDTVWHAQLKKKAADGKRPVVATGKTSATPATASATSPAPTVVSVPATVSTTTRVDPAPRPSRSIDEDNPYNKKHP